MDKIEIEKPIPCPEAFFERSNLSDYSKAAFLLSLGIMLDPSDNYNKEDLLEPYDDFPLPSIKKMSKLISTNELANIVSKGTDERTKRESEDFIYQRSIEHIENIFNSTDNQFESLILISEYIHHPNELLRVSAAISWLDTISNVNEHPKLTHIGIEY